MTLERSQSIPLAAPLATLDLDALRAVGVLAPLDVHFARTMGRLGAEQRPEVLLAAALASRQVREGHVCLELDQGGRALALRGADDQPVSLACPAPDTWRALLRESPLVAAPGECDRDHTTPLVLDEVGRLYLRRYFEHEQSLADAIRARASGFDDTLDLDWLKQALGRLFASRETIDWQRFGAAVALRSRFSVISGGPGTGKTFTVVNILALRIEAAMRGGAKPPRIALAAPTGKAAARLNESLRRTKESLRVAPQVREAIPENAATIHRLLGSLGGSGVRFRYHRDNPLPADVVLVDEASMVDLGLMRRLVDAVAPAASIILLGDKDQLASVEAGAVLGDICNTGRPWSCSKAMARQWHDLAGEVLPISSDAPEQRGIWDCIVELTESRRYSADSGIARLAAAVRAGEADLALDLLGASDLRDVEQRDLSRANDFDGLLHSAAAAFEPYLLANTPAEGLQALNRFRLLCAHRRGDTGVEEINAGIERVLAAQGRVDLDNVFYDRRPILISRNDYPAQLFNGDVGVIWRDGDSLAAHFEGSEPRPRRLALSRLPEHVTVYAMSVHKSQGSELDEVALVLPDEPSPVVSRELLYTAITRARQRVTIYGSRDVIADAIRKPIRRTSGLRDALWQR